jgi:tight adherence protein B
MGALLGLVLGLGLVLVWQSFQPARVAAPRRGQSRRERAQEVLVQAGLESVTPGALAAASLGMGLVAALLALVLTRSWALALAFGLIATAGPRALVTSRARRRRTELRELWPEAVDNLASAVRAGLSLPEALAQLGVRGPEPLRPAFARFGEDYRATGRFGECLDRLKAALADPVGDRIVESLRMAREVGGSDLGSLLRTLSAFLREEARTRAELRTRQGWTVNAARLAVAAPWVVLGLLSVNSAAGTAYDSGAGLVVLVGGAGTCFVAYRLMLRIGRLPEEERVLR